MKLLPLRQVCKIAKMKPHTNIPNQICFMLFNVQQKGEVYKICKKYVHFYLAEGCAQQFLIHVCVCVCSYKV